MKREHDQLNSDFKKSKDYTEKLEIALEKIADETQANEAIEKLETMKDEKRGMVVRLLLPYSKL